ncbi:restriction endonuclease subunit S [Prescottella subtropica]|uniref:restriction endonuclease subunit S n=1 Tax=Prescottella subtropica TaxID=2545757 RepID=UPI0010F82F00|nr:restriction endonuclease subunit S [Prescottella subtropica]
MRETTLGELCAEGGGGIQTGPFGSQLHASDYVAVGVPSVMPQNIGDNVIFEQEIARITEGDAERLSKYRLREFDIVYSRRGDVEKRALVREHNDGWLCGTGCLRVRFGTDPVCDPVFMSYYLGTEESRTWIKSHAVGATMPNLNTGILSALPVKVPELSEQRAIAEVLGALDDKIAANRKLVAKCEELSSVNFAQMLEHATSIPLSRTAEFINGKAFTKGASGTGRVVVRIAELNSGIGGSTVFNDIEVDDKHVARPGDILFAWSGSLTLHRWFRDEAIVNQHIFKVLPAEGYPSWLVHQLIARKLQQFRDIAADKATTMGHIQRRHLDETVDVPVAELIAEHDSLMSGLWQIALTAEQESEVLTATRDALLPRLMSGELRVRDAERVVEGGL